MQRIQICYLATLVICFTVRVVLADIYWNQVQPEVNTLGSATYFNNSLLLTNQSNEVGAIWWTSMQKITNGFVATIDFTLGQNNTPPTYFAFVIQANSDTIVSTTTSSDGFDFENNFATEIGILHVAVYGNSPNSPNSLTNTVAKKGNIGEIGNVTTTNGGPKTIVISYDHQQKQLTAITSDDVTPRLQTGIDITSYVNLINGYAWVGFTGTSGSTSLVITNFTFANNDTNICATSNCSANATCISQANSYTCQCNSGFIGNGTFCEVVYPGTPILQVNNIQDGSFVLSWSTPSSGFPLYGYFLICYMNEVYELFSTTLYANVTNYKVNSGVSPSTNYTCSVYAYDVMDNAGPWSNNVTFETQNASPPVQAGFTADMKTSSPVPYGNFSWSYIAGYYPISGYVFTVSPVGYPTVLITNSSTPNASFSRFIPNVPHVFTLYAYDITGLQSQASNNTFEVNSNSIYQCSLCSSNSLCLPVNDSYSCFCNSGYFGNGTSCYKNLLQPVLQSNVKYESDEAYILISWTPASLDILCYYGLNFSVDTQNDFRAIYFGTNLNYTFQSLLVPSPLYFRVIAICDEVYSNSSTTIEVTPPGCLDAICQTTFGENCSSCPQDCCPSTLTTCSHACVHGKCEYSQCVCFSPYSGPDCSYIPNKVDETHNHSKPAIDLRINSTIFQLNILEIAELDKDGIQLSNYTLSKFGQPTNFSEKGNSSFEYYYLFGNGASLNISCTLYLESEDFIFADQNISIAPNTLKITLTISSWNFASIKNTLRITLSVNSTNNNGECDESIKYNDSDQWMIVSTGSYTLYGQHSSNGLVDGVPVPVTTKFDNNLCFLSIPHFWSSVVLDPNYSVLFENSDENSGSGCREKSKKSKVGVYVGVPITIIVVIVVAIAAAHFLLKREQKTAFIQFMKRAQARLTPTVGEDNNGL